MTSEEKTVHETLSVEESVEWWDFMYEDIMENAFDEDEQERDLARIGPQPDGKTDQIKLDSDGERIL